MFIRDGRISQVQSLPGKSKDISQLRDMKEVIIEMAVSLRYCAAPDLKIEQKKRKKNSTQRKSETMTTMA